MQALQKPHIFCDIRTYNSKLGTLTLHLPKLKSLVTMSYPRIAIIGAGPSRLTLARLLVKGSIIPHVYERDPSPDYRPQGGTLDLHGHSGLLALREAGLWDEFLKHARYDS